MEEILHKLVGSLSHYLQGFQMAFSWLINGGDPNHHSAKQAKLTKRSKGSHV